MSYPSVGRAVHYVSMGSPIQPDGTQKFPSVCRAAVITEFEPESGLIGLCVFNPTGQFFHSLDQGGLHEDESKSPGTWHWPEMTP